MDVLKNPETGLKAHQIEDLFTEDENTSLKKIPLSPRLTLYVSISLIIFFTLSGFLLKFQFYNDISGLIESRNTETSVYRIKVLDTDLSSLARENTVTLINTENQETTGIIHTIENLNQESILIITIEIAIKNIHKNSMVIIRVPGGEKNIFNILFDIKN